MITIIDYGAGNLISVATTLTKLGAKPIISSRARDIEAADKLLLPGVGSLGTGMKNLHELGLIEILHRKVLEEKTPILGICLGLQMFTRHSEEGDAAGLGWIDAETKRFSFEGPNPPKIPHLGWNEVNFCKSHPVLEEVNSGSCFYFAHSYRVICRNESDVLARTNYGGEFVSAIQHENIFGIQFHAEKSHRTGFRLLRNFLGQ
jgi:glutamine amidotransferase